MQSPLTHQGPDADVALTRFHSGLHLVERIARGIHRRGSRFLTLDDLRALGREGLLEAARTFDGDLGVPFDAWARLRIRGAIVDALRRCAMAHEREKRLAGEVQGMADRAPHPEELLARAHIVRALSDAIAKLPRAERAIVEAYDLGSETLARAAASVGVSRSRGSHLRARALDRLASEVAHLA